jgi:hypothetical protein
MIWLFAPRYTPRSRRGGRSDNSLKLDRLHEPCVDREDKSHVRMYARGR